jgi:hypothetical protein
VTQQLYEELCHHFVVLERFSHRCYNNVTPSAFEIKKISVYLGAVSVYLRVIVRNKKNLGVSPCNSLKYLISSTHSIYYPHCCILMF